MAIKAVDLAGYDETQPVRPSVEKSVDAPEGYEFTGGILFAESPGGDMKRYLFRFENDEVVLTDS